MFKLPPLVAGNPIIFTWRADDVQSAHLVALASFVIATLVVTPSNRGRFLHWLNAKLRTGGTKAQEAASVLALLGNRSAAATLIIKATDSFRALPLEALTVE